jgi:plastocyanin
MPQTRTRKMLIAAVIAAFLVWPSFAHATMHTVHVGNFYFTPTKTTVNQGDTVRWVLDGGTHTTTSDVTSPKQWDSGIFSVGGHFDVVFAAADGLGPFPYHCSIHPTTMKDTIFVNPPIVYVCGDANHDTKINVGDAVYIINYVFRGGPAPNPLGAGDANCDGHINVGDAVYLITYIFRGGPAPCCP